MGGELLENAKKVVRRKEERATATSFDRSRAVLLSFFGFFFLLHFLRKFIIRT